MYRKRGRETPEKERKLCSTGSLLQMVIPAVCVVCPQMKNVLKNASTANSFQKSLLNSYPGDGKGGRAPFYSLAAVHNLFTIIFENPVDKLDEM